MASPAGAGEAVAAAGEPAQLFRAHPRTETRRDRRPSRRWLLDLPRRPKLAPLPRDRGRYSAARPSVKKISTAMVYCSRNLARSSVSHGMGEVSERQTDDQPQAGLGCLVLARSRFPTKRASPQGCAVMRSRFLISRSHLLAPHCRVAEGKFEFFEEHRAQQATPTASKPPPEEPSSSREQEPRRATRRQPGSEEDPPPRSLPRRGSRRRAQTMAGHLEEAGVVPATSDALRRIPSLGVRAGPADKEWPSRLKEELGALISYIRDMKARDSDWVTVRAAHARGVGARGERYATRKRVDTPRRRRLSAPPLPPPLVGGPPDVERPQVERQVLGLR